MKTRYAARIRTAILVARDDYGHAVWTWNGYELGSLENKAYTRTLRRAWERQNNLPPMPRARRGVGL